MTAAARTAWWGLVSAAAAPVLLIGGWTLAARRQPGGFDSVTQTISELAAYGTTDRWVMTAALVGVGVCHLTTAAALRSAAPPGRLVLAGGGMATVLVAAFPLTVGGGPVVAHTVVATAALGALALWPLGAGRREGPTMLRPPVGFAAGAVLVAALAWFTVELVTQGDRVGLSERVAAGSQAVWPLAAVLGSRAGRT